MGIDDNLIKEYKSKVEKFPLNEYKVESREGKELEDTAYALLAIKDEVLSPEMIIQRDSLLTQITSEKLKGFV